MRALIYCRNSAGVERSVEEQETEGRAECKRNRWTVAEVVVDLVGASRHSRGTRTGWARAQGLIRSGKVDVLVTWASSRAQRDMDAYVELRRLCVSSGVLWSYSGRVYDLADKDDRFRTGMDALIAERDAEEISFNVRRAMRANAAAGKPHGRRLFGYRRTYDPTTGALAGQDIDPDEAEVVREVFRDYLSGTPVHAIVRDLNERSILTAAGREWTDQKIRRMLTRASYAGRRTYQGEVIGDAAWPAIIDPQTFDHVQTRLSLTSTRQPPNPSLLGGVARCGKCGGPIRASSRQRYMCVKGWCVARPRTTLDGYVSAKILEHLATITAAPKTNHGAEERAEIEACRARIDEATEQFLRDDLTAATLAKIERAQLARIRDLEADLRRRTLPVAVDVGSPRRIGAWWKRLDIAQKRAVLVAVVAVVKVSPTGRGSKAAPDEYVKIEWS